MRESIAGSSKARNVLKVKNHIVILVEPGSQFVGHITPKGPLAADESTVEWGEVGHVG